MPLPSNTSSNPVSTLKVGSLNVWNPGPNRLEREKGLAAMMRGADIVLLQELDRRDPDQAMRLAKLANMNYAKSVDDVGIVSAHPFINFRPYPVKRQPSLLPLNQLFMWECVPFCYGQFLINERVHHVFSNHWDHRAEDKCRSEAASAAMKAVASLPKEDVILFGGDFNEVRGRKNVDAFMLASGLKEAFRPDQDSHCSQVSRVDMLFHRGLTTHSYRAECPDGDPNSRPTDHPFLFVEFSVPPRPALS